MMATRPMRCRSFDKGVTRPAAAATAAAAGCYRTVQCGAQRRYEDVVLLKLLYCLSRRGEHIAPLVVVGRPSETAWP
jgi:hypothetical protein